jgi:hypothetical protein
MLNINYIFSFQEEFMVELTIAKWILRSQIVTLQS